MAANRRRWTNDLLDSLMEFQSKDQSSDLVDSLEGNKTIASIDLSQEKSTNITSILATLTLDSTPMSSNSNQFSSKEHSACTTALSDSGNESVSSRPAHDVLNLSMTEMDDGSDSAPETSDLMKMNVSMLMDVNNMFGGMGSPTSAPLVDCLFDLNGRLSENIELSSDSCTIKVSSCGSDSRGSMELRLESRAGGMQQGIDLNERVEEVEVSSDSGTIRVMSSCDSSGKTITGRRTAESLGEQSVTAIFKEAQTKQQRFFSSPLEFAQQTDQTLIGEMHEPDVWDALLALDEALSPFEARDQSFQQAQDPPHILTRLSQKFKQTPTRFTEKLVSLIEDSIISFESPTKQSATNDTSGISLNRMTGEFRKLCKFIEDESMPDLAPSLANMTASYLNKTETPEFEKTKEIPKNLYKHMMLETPTKQFSPKAFQGFFTPQNKKTGSNANTPINRFTPSADKSFEYWETVCNMMCDPASGKKLNKSLCIPESTKLSMDEMMSICERQLASLDDSAMDIRCSEPCKKTGSAVKLGTPRSKSVSRMYATTAERMKKSSVKKRAAGEMANRVNGKQLNFEDDAEVAQVKESDEVPKDSVKERELIDLFDKTKDLSVGEEDATKEETLTHAAANANIGDSFTDDFDLLDSSAKLQDEDFSTEDDNPYAENDQDCSLLIELAKRRQRCLDTAKLMLEIEREDPITNDDNTCLETLYKLGIQDKTFAEVEEDTKFLNTLGHCLEYKSYLKNKSKPVIDMLQKVDSPDDLRDRLIKSKKLVGKVQPFNVDLKDPVMSKPRVQPKQPGKPLQDKKLTARVAPVKPLPRVTPKVDKKMTHTPRLTPRLEKKVPQQPTHLHARSTPKVQQQQQPMHLHARSTPKVAAKAPQPQSSQRKASATTTPRPLIKTPQRTSVHPTPKESLKPESKPTTTPRTLSQLSIPQISLTPESSVDDGGGSDESSSAVSREDTTPKSSPKLRLFVTPGKSPGNNTTLGRRRPASYFTEAVVKKPTTPRKLDYTNVKSPIGLYIHGTDTDLIQNVQGRTNDRLLTPVKTTGTGTGTTPGKVAESPRLKFKLDSKENKSPAICDENMVLPTVRYHSAKKVRTIDDKSNFSPSSVTPNSKTKKLLANIENTVVIRHEGRVIDYSPKSDDPDPEMSIHVKKVAEKATSLRRRFM